MKRDINERFIAYNLKCTIGEVIMKRIIFIAALMLFVMALGGCEYKKGSSIMGYDASEIESVDIYCISEPDEVNKKRVTLSTDIDAIVQSFSKMRAWSEASDSEMAEDGDEINMCIKLNDGTEELIMVNGKVVSCELGNYYVSGNMFDVVFYNSLRYPEEQVDANDMPFNQFQKDLEKLDLKQKKQGLGIDIVSYGKYLLQYIRALYFSHQI